MTELPRGSKLILILLIALGVKSGVFFFVWLFQPEHVGQPILFGLILASAGFKIGRSFLDWYHFAHIKIPEDRRSPAGLKVDVFTTACPGEPRSMIINTLKAMKKIRYPHENYLLDEGDDPILRGACASMGIHHVTRTEKIDAKAGNVNNALRQATGDYVLILDPDHVPAPEFLDKTLGHFDDPRVGYVQCVQGYYNQDRSLIAKGAAEQTYVFYGPTMMGMNGCGTTLAIGANCLFRRKALDSIGGHAAGLSEDLHTSMRIHSKGWKSVYVPLPLSRGLVPEDLHSFFKQQLKWSRGCFELLFEKLPTLWKGWTLRQKLQYLSVPTYFLNGLVTLIDLFVPMIFLIWGVYGLSIDLEKYLAYFLPFVLCAFAIKLYIQSWLADPAEKGLHLTGGFLRLATWYVFILGFVYSIVRKRIPYIPTPKEGQIDNCWKLVWPNLIVAPLSVGAVVFAWSAELNPFSIIMGSFCLWNAASLLFVTLAGQRRLVLRTREAVAKVAAAAPIRGIPVRSR